MQDEDSARRIKNLEKEKKIRRKNLLTKHGFSDEEDGEDENSKSLKALLQWIWNLI